MGLVNLFHAFISSQSFFPTVVNFVGVYLCCPYDFYPVEYFGHH